MLWAEVGADLQTRGYQPGFRSLWVPRLPDLIPVQGEPRETMGIVQWQENHPSRWTCAQEELSVPEASKEGPVGGSLGLWGEDGGLDPEGPVLSPLTALWLPSSRLCPHQWPPHGARTWGSSTWRLCHTGFPVRGWKTPMGPQPL